MEMIRLSIVVPVYNVERWLGRCLESLYRQGLSEMDFEVVVVNDGTTDNSMAVAEGFRTRHGNLRIINRENGGLSAARNTGLEAAKGKYVWFVDSDDFIEPDSIKPILEYAEANDMDIMCFYFQLAYEDGTKKMHDYKPHNADIIYNGEDFVTKTGFVQSPWAAIYKKSFLEDNNLRYMEGILHEDHEFSPRAQFLAQRIAHTDKIVYNYFQRAGSIMKSSRSEIRVKSFLAICDSLYDFKHKHVPAASPAVDFFNGNIFFCFTQAMSHLSHCKKRDLQQFRSKPYFPLALPEGMKGKVSMKAMLINRFPILYINILKLRNKLQ
ncbi:MAG: glycosyltransferase [Lachnospiraceae bacterium]|nr:glycosyltransferase [Lachnospiraceae bacterium]